MPARRTSGSCSTAVPGAAPRSCRASTTRTTPLYGITSTDRSFAFNCPSTKCEFHEQIPVQVIDDGLYDAPPTFLLGTVDKFAQLAWVPESGVLFGRSAGNRPPTLIIQDELHLLTGPLGTTVGLYEAAINLLCEVDDRPPKVISSTATIRRASAQIMGLFGRPVDLFPPSGIDADDSYFARVGRGDTGAAVRRHDGAGPHL